MTAALPLHGRRIALSPAGSALEFKSPVPWEVFASEGARAILEALALEAPATVDGVVVVTSTWRPSSGASGWSWHLSAEAIDWRTGLSRTPAGRLELDDRRGSILAPTPDEALEVARAWAERLRRRLGSNYDVVFGDARHIDHGHAERDGRKAGAVYRRG